MHRFRFKWALIMKHWPLTKLNLEQKEKIYSIFYKIRTIQKFRRVMINDELKFWSSHSIFKSIPKYLLHILSAILNIRSLFFSVFFLFLFFFFRLFSSLLLNNNATTSDISTFYSHSQYCFAVKLNGKLYTYCECE